MVSFQLCQLNLVHVAYIDREPGICASKQEFGVLPCAEILYEIREAGPRGVHPDDDRIGVILVSTGPQEIIDVLCSLQADISVQTETRIP